MRLERLHLKNFRNIREACIEAGAISILKGANAQGKTSILEAIFFLATGCSPRTTRIQEVKRWGSGTCKVSGYFRGNTGEFELEIRLGSNRQWRLNNTGISDTSELPSKVCVVLFGPDDLQVIKGPPAYRRRFLDLHLSSVDIGYSEELKRYYRVLYQRNSLLQSFMGKTRSLDLIEVIDDQLAGLGSALMCKRFFALREIEASAARHYSLISGTGDTFSLCYRPGARLDEDDYSSAESIRQHFLKRLVNIRQQDVSRGTTTEGPHKDDFSVLVGGTDFRTFGSQGQVRTALVSMKMAEVSVVRERSGEEPILLLDDVMSELDSSRRRNLLNVGGGGQVFITCTDLDVVKGGAPFFGGDQLRVFQVADGKVYRE